MHSVRYNGLTRPFLLIFRQLLRSEIQQITFKSVFSTYDTDSLFEEATAYLISFITNYELLIYYNQHNSFVQDERNFYRLKNHFNAR